MLRKPTKPDDPAQSKRFIETDKKVGADDEEALEPRSRKSPRNALNKTEIEHRYTVGFQFNRNNELYVAFSSFWIKQSVRLYGQTRH